MESTIIDLSVVGGYALEALAGLILALGSWAVHKLAQKFGMENDDKLRAVVMTAVTNGVAYGKKKAKAELDSADWAKIEVENVLVGHAATYVLSKVPDTVARFNLSEEDIKDLVLSKLGD